MVGWVPLYLYLYIHVSFSELTMTEVKKRKLDGNIMEVDDVNVETNEIFEQANIAVLLAQEGDWKLKYNFYELNLSLYVYEIE